MGCGGEEGYGVDGKGDRRTCRFVGRGWRCGRRLLLDALVVELGVLSFRRFGRLSRICGDEGTKASKGTASLVLVS